MRSYLALAAFAAKLATASLTSSAYTDSKTGITFQRFVDDDTGYAFGMALPEDAGSDFIGQIVAPSNNSEGWAGISLTSSMMASVLIAAWPNGDDIVSTLRETNAYSNPAALSGDSKLSPISKGTFVNSTHYSYTFLCTDCITGDSQSFDVTDDTAVMGWALSDTAPTTPAKSNSVLGYHSAGFGEYGMQLSKAKSADYSTWAAMASASTIGSNSTTTTGSNSTTSAGSSSSSSSLSNTTLAAPTTLNTTYDYIVVGGGAAGLIVAERLAESKASVLLLERGGASTYSSGNKNTVSWNSSVTPFDVPAYGYAVQSSEAAALCTDTASTAGCVLGGSGSINAEMFVRPQERDFENWPTGWKWEDIKDAAAAFYERNPGTQLPSLDGRRYDQGTYNVLAKMFQRSGWTETDAIAHPNEKHNVYAHPPWNIKDGLRAGPVKTYLPLAQQYSNFKLQMQTKVLKVVRNGSAIEGVEVQLESGATQIIKVNDGGKVILAGGTMSTPRILFNSGIGPADQLEIVQSGSTGISLPASSSWIDLPVGQGLKDHPIFKLTLSVKSNNLTAYSVQSPANNDVNMFALGSGPLVQGMQRLNFWTSVDGPDGITRFIQGTTSTAGENEISMKVYLTHGLTSAGRLGITADGVTEFVTKPWLTTSADKAAIQTFMSELITYINNSGDLSIESTTGGNVTAADLTSTYITGDHFVGTAKMGTDSGLKNGSAVVDTNTKVYGTDNLFVVDASIHPDLPTGNTQAIVMIAAEQAAKKIIALGSGSSETSTVTSTAIVGSVTTVPESGSGSGSAESSSVAASDVQAVSTSTPAASKAVAGSGSGISTLTTTITLGGSTTVLTTVLPAATAAPGSGNAGSGSGDAGSAEAATVTTTVTLGESTTIVTLVAPGAASVTAAPQSGSSSGNVGSSSGSSGSGSSGSDSSGDSGSGSETVTTTVVVGEITTVVTVEIPGTSATAAAGNSGSSSSGSYSSGSGEGEGSSEADSAHTVIETITLGGSTTVLTITGHAASTTAYAASSVDAQATSYIASISAAAAAQATSFATSYVAAGVTPPASNWTIPTNVLNSLVPSLPTATVTGDIIPDAALPAGTTVGTVVEWVAWVIESLYSSASGAATKAKKA